MVWQDAYQLNDLQINALYEALADNFFEDELYKMVFPNAKTRKRLLRYLFKHYIKTIRPYSHFLADDEHANCVMVVYDTALEVSWKYHVRLFYLNMKMIPMLISLHSWKSIRHVVKSWDMFTSRWVKAFIVADAYHIDLLFTRKDYRHQGKAQQLVDIVCNKAKVEHKDVTLETHHEQNVSLYERSGFQLMEIISHPDGVLKQYCLLIRNSEVAS